MDIRGLPHAITVTTADVTDRQGALNAIGQHIWNLSEVSVILTDGGYTGRPFADAVLALIGVEVHVVKRSSQTLGRRKVICLAGKVSKTLEKYGMITQHQPAIRQPRFFGFVITKILNRFLSYQLARRDKLLLPVFIIKRLTCLG